MPSVPDPPGADLAGCDGPNGRADLVGRDLATVWHPYAPMPAVHPPVPVVAAQGVRLQLADGRQVIDGMSSWWAAVHGYRHPVLDAAIQRQLADMAHVMFGGLTHPSAIELAERLVEITPPGLNHVFLADSGSVAVEVAMKVAMQVWRGRNRPERHRFVAMRGGYHGDTLGAMSVCDPVTGMHSMFASVLPRQLFAPVPSPGYHETFDESHVDGLRTVLQEHHHEVAAVILEPIVQGAGGMRFSAPAYLRAVRDLCDEFEVLLIADEIATGFGRTGELFGCDHAAVAPDILCLGKAMTGGYLTMAAMLCTTEVAAAASRAEAGALMHGPTFMGNPLAAAVLLASIDLLLHQPWKDTVARIQSDLLVGLGALADAPGVRDVRVLGAIGVVELDDDVDMVTSQTTLLGHGVWLRPFGNLLYTMPPYVSTTDDVSAICAAMTAVVAEAR